MKITLAFLFFILTGFFAYSDELITISEGSVAQKSKELAHSFFKAHQVNDVKISPNGEFIALRQNTGKLSQLVLLSTKTFKKNVIIEDKFDDSMDITNFYWIDNTSIILEAYIRGKGSKYKLNKRAPSATHWITDSVGNITLGYGFDESELKNKVWIKNLKSKRWKEIWQGDEKTIFRPVLVSKNI
jgi:hypothetical protein